MSDLKLLYQIMVEYYGMEFNQKTRLREVSEKKMMFANVAHLLDFTYAQIANFIGWMNHSVAVYSSTQMDALISIYPKFRVERSDILEEFKFRKAVGLLAN